jgi:hypothetical protein
VVHSGILDSFKPGDYSFDSFLQDELWIIQVLDPDGTPVGLELHLRHWKDGMRVTMAVLKKPLAH